ncbi:MAG TPA: malto-oligosyltrehalose synthase [Steroidobacteraceae bacterium]|nr:malto-oligosyltrehalose synthase [Steroidobacteraceae bacterium]
MSVPRATYRVQLNAGFTFRDATAIVPYLSDLGISHVYCSPYFRARAGSLHGYDVIDHNSLNPEIGTREDFEDFVTALRSRGMGHIVDVVPNHVGIMGADNAWWMDVLENGEASRYAEFFDIEWHPANVSLDGKVLVPVLGDAYGAVLERGELELRFEADPGSFSVFYHEHRLPLDPATYPRVLERVLAHLPAPEIQILRREFGELLDRRAVRLEQIGERHAAKEALKSRLAALCKTSPATRAAVDLAVRSFSVDKSVPAGSDALHELLEAQAYRLAYWRVASDEINYRRFFDVNDLAALRVENVAVFDATHRLLLELAGAGKIDGLRIDHPDGLHDPAEYFHRLQNRVADARAGLVPKVADLPDARAGLAPEVANVSDAAGAATTIIADVLAGGPDGVSSGPRDFGVAGKPRELPIYLIVEKITASFEHLPAGWPVHGETGYHFANVVNRMLVDPATKGRMDRVYAGFIDEIPQWQNIAYESQHMILRRSLASELTVVTNQLSRIAQADRRTRDFTFNSLRQALAEVIACFPVYRTYIDGSVSEADRRYIDWAIAAARRRRSAAETAVFDFVRAALLLELPASNDGLRQRMRAFAMKFQQVTAPVTAKGIEDTALYRFDRLVSLNEVGGEPDAYGTSVRAFHAANQHRSRCWPHEMVGTSTHDTKRSGDVRARIDVLSEMTQVWRKTIERWARMNRLRKREVEGRPAPSANDEYLLYQTLMGTWPLEDLDEAALTSYRERIEGYMVKAAREAKTRTSWASVNTDYEEALTQFIRAALEARDANLFLADLTQVCRRLGRFGLLNGLSQELCKLTVPGVPDLYQGNEIWDYSLVDPDNRRPVDYDRRRTLLAEVRRHAEGPTERLTPWLTEIISRLEDGRSKLFLISQILRFRREHSALFDHGDYVPLRATGEHSTNVCAFARRHESGTALIIAPRLYLRLAGASDAVPLGEVAWKNTAIELPAPMAKSNADTGSTRLRNVLDRCDVPVSHASGRLFLRLADALSRFPVALLATVNSAA